MYSSTMIANNILSRLFGDKVYITPMKLQRILYFTAAEYQKATHKPLLEEPFSTWACGPVAYSVYNKFCSFNKHPIKRYARDAQGKTLMIDEESDIELRIALDRVWGKTKMKSATNLSTITHAQDSAWDKAFQQYKSTLESADIENDYTYRVPLGIKTS